MKNRYIFKMQFIGIIAIVAVIGLLGISCDTNGDKSNGDSHIHQWAWVETRAPNETEDGEEVRQCSCGATDGTSPISRGIVYAQNDNGWSVIGYEGESNEVFIPATHKGLAVLSIGYNAFQENDEITSIRIPASIAAIGNGTFRYCINLETVTFAAGNRLEAIGNQAFSYTSLKTIEIPASVVSIGNYAFASEICYSYDDCCNDVTCAGSLESITFATGSQLRSIGNYAFYYNAKLTNINIPASVDSIGRGAFEYCAGLETVTFAAGSRLGEIRQDVFGGNTSLVNIVIPASVTSIGPSAFRNCRSLVNIVIPANVTRIQYGAFQNCENLETVTFAAGSQLAAIGGQAFENCTKIERIEIPASVITWLDEGAWRAFGNWTEEQTIRIPFASVADAFAAWGTSWYIGSDAVIEASTDSEDLNIITTPDGFDLVRVGAGYMILGYDGDASEVVIPASHEGLAILSIQSYAFRGNDDITSLTIPASITSIGNGAFRNCRNLETVTFAAGSQLVAIGNQAFSNTNLKTIQIPANVVSIGNNAFNNCENLETVTFAAGSRLTSIGGSAFRYAGLKTIEIPASLTHIGGNAFEYCENLETVTFAAGSRLTTVGYGAFMGCVSLVNIDLPAGITLIPPYMFQNCTSLESIVIPASVTRIGYHAFENCESLESITFAAGSRLTHINNNAFAGCTSIEHLEIPGSVTSFNHSVFMGWTEEQTIRIPFATLDEADAMWGGSNWRQWTENWWNFFYIDAKIENNAGELLN